MSFFLAVSVSVPPPLSFSHFLSSLAAGTCCRPSLLSVCLFFSLSLFQAPPPLSLTFSLRLLQEHVVDLVCSLCVFLSPCFSPPLSVSYFLPVSVHPPPSPSLSFSFRLLQEHVVDLALSLSPSLLPVSVCLSLRFTFWVSHFAFLILSHFSQF